MRIAKSVKARSAKFANAPTTDQHTGWLNMPLFIHKPEALMRIFSKTSDTLDDGVRKAKSLCKQAASQREDASDAARTDLRGLLDDLDDMVSRGRHVHVDDLRHDLRDRLSSVRKSTGDLGSTLRDGTRGLASTMRDRASGLSSSMRDRADDLSSSVRGRARELGSNVRGQMNGLGSSVSESINEALDSADELVRGKPWHIIGAVAAATLLLGFLAGRG